MSSICQGTARLAESILPLEASIAARYARHPGQKLRRFKTFSYAARSRSKPRRVIARVEVSPSGRDTRYIVTNLEGGRGKHLYEKVYSARGQAENHIKAWKAHLASDRTSCSKVNANQMRLMLHGCACWIWWTLRAACPKRSPWPRAQFDTLRLHLVKLAATIVEKKTRIIVTLPASCPRHQYANHAAWLEDNRRTDNGTLAHIVVSNSMGAPVSRAWKGYWQRAA